MIKSITRWIQQCHQRFASTKSSTEKRRAMIGASEANWCGRNVFWCCTFLYDVYYLWFVRCVSNWLYIYIRVCGISAVWLLTSLVCDVSINLMNVHLELLTYLFVYVLGVLDCMVPIPFWLKADIHLASGIWNYPPTTIPFQIVGSCYPLKCSIWLRCP